MKRFEVWNIIEKNAKKHPRFMKYIKYNIFGFSVFLVSSFVYWLFGAGGWLAFIAAGFFGGLFEFSIQDRFVYGHVRLFQRLHPNLKRIDELLMLNE